jgi:hypothetical protein
LGGRSGEVLGWLTYPGYLYSILVIIIFELKEVRHTLRKMCSHQALRAPGRLGPPSAVMTTSKNLLKYVWEKDEMWHNLCWCWCWCWCWCTGANAVDNRPCVLDISNKLFANYLCNQVKFLGFIEKLD